MAGVMAAGEERKERRILVAVDDSEESMYALSWCLANVVSENPANISKDTVILLYAKPRPAVYTAMDGTGYSFSSDIVAMTERYNNRVADSVMEKAKRMCEEFSDVKVETRVENGDARDVICQVAEKLDPDVLVMGSHGYGIIKRALLGSVSYYCAQNVKCPVLVVKKPKSSVSN
ncbi:universal stress protein A-like protein isoform X2 [Punica granatum]|uniref:Universal stress protein A-like protein isoform X2 n=1 Tax=Punica granatum TaxID=22663 RepID=A0A6P8EE73_PUNGR|nr:universal stress protein A-like protein isoform X2 [Punica granatum]